MGPQQETVEQEAKEQESQTTEEVSETEEVQSETVNEVSESDVNALKEVVSKEREARKKAEDEAKKLKSERNSFFKELKAKLNMEDEYVNSEKALSGINNLLKTFEESNSKAKATEVKLAVYELSEIKKVNPQRLLDSLSFNKAIEAIDSSDKNKIEAAIDEAIKKDSSLKKQVAKISVENPVTEEAENNYSGLSEAVLQRIKRKP